MTASDPAIDLGRVAAYLAGQGIRCPADQPVRRLSGGLANRNYLLLVDGKPAVLRRPPDGPLPPGAHDMAREHRVMSRLAPALPIVPASFHYCADPAVTGAAFQLIEYRPGLVVRGSDLSQVGAADAGARLSRMLVETLAAIHAVDPERVGLGDLGRPAGFAERAVAGWAKRGRAATAGRSTAALVEELAAALAEAPAPGAPTLLHADFKLDNIVLDPDTLQPRAVVDWDMGTRGDPLFDLATLLSYWAEPGDPEVMQRLDQMPTARPGFWTREEAAARYAALTGRRLDDLHFWRVLTMLKLGVVFLQLHNQLATGAVRDERYRGFQALGDDLLLLARDIAKGNAR